MSLRDATAIGGRDHICSVLAQLIARRPRPRVDPLSRLALGDLTPAGKRWTPRSEGLAPVQEGTAATLLARWIESEWKLALLAPWGWPR